MNYGYFGFHRVCAAKWQELQAAQEAVDEMAQADGADVRASRDVRTAQTL